MSGRLAKILWLTRYGTGSAKYAEVELAAAFGLQRSPECCKQEPSPMTAQQEGQWVVPNPSVPRAFGLMNIVFGAIMLLVGAGYIATWLIMPTFMRQAQVQIKTELAEQKAKHDKKVAELKKQEETAKTEEEKAEIRTERDELEKNIEPDMSGMTDLMGWNILSDKRLAFYYFSEAGTGILLNLLSIISGAGLMALAEWARKLALGVASLKILRWVAMLVGTMVLVMPVTAVKTEKAMSAVEAQAKAQSGGKAVVFPARQMGQITAIAGVIMMAFGAVLAWIYPGLTLWFLTRPATRAACLQGTTEGPAPKPPDQGEWR
jgi:hypothetical protein